MPRFALVALLAFVPAAAQARNCAAPMTQADMTQCAALDYQAADRELNRVYKLAIARARQMDAYLRPGETPAVQILRDAQRAWIPFRDKACEAESLLARGGSMQSQLYYSCLEQLTLERTKGLRFFVDLS